MDVTLELLDMNPHWMGRKYEVKNRDKKIDLLPNKLNVIIGPRRAGKTFYLRHLINEFISSQLPSKRILYVDFFHPFMVDYTNHKKFIHLVNQYIKQQKIEYQELYLFIDEIQELNEWDKVTEYFRGRGVKVILTGSNASLLSEDIGYRLVGRYTSFEIFTLSFKEYLSWKNINNKLSDLREYLEDYSFSSFPEYVLYERKEVISQTFYDIIYRDIFWRYNIREKGKFMDFISYLLENVGRYLSYKRASNVVDLSEKIIKEFSFHLENSYLFYFIPRYSLKTTDIIKSPRKIYVLDNSFAILKRKKFLEEKGRYMENLVFLELKRKGEKVYYYQTKDRYEVDFILKDSEGIKELIQVAYNVSETKTLNREIRALLHAKEDLKLGNEVKLTVITWDYEDEREVEWWKKRGRIKFVPLWKWLLKV